MSFVHIKMKWEKGGKKGKKEKKMGARRQKRKQKWGEGKESFQKGNMKAQEKKTLNYVLLPKKSGL